MAGHHHISTEAAAITTVQSDEMDANMEEYFQGEKHQLGRHVTMLLILLITMILVSWFSYYKTGHSVGTGLLQTNSPTFRELSKFGETSHC